jgi:hypothetical protein
MKLLHSVMGFAFAAAACLSAAPASADYYAFGFTGNDGNETLTLTLSDSSIIVLNTNGFQGWFSPNASNDGAGPDFNTNYITGSYGGSLWNNFFVFDLSQIQGTVVSAALGVTNGTLYNGPLTYNLWDVTTPVGLLYDGLSPNAAIYNDLGSGISYGSFALTDTNFSDIDNFALDAAAIAEINAIISEDCVTNFCPQDFAIGGSVNSPSTFATPEPFTLSLFGAGFVGAAAMRRRRRVNKTI